MTGYPVALLLGAQAMSGFTIKEGDLATVGARLAAARAESAEIAEAVAFLASPRSRFNNGRVLRVDGGETLFPG